MPPVGMKLTSTYGAGDRLERNPTHRLLGGKELERRQSLLERRFDFRRRGDARKNRNSCSRQYSTIRGPKPGATMNCAPASRASFACSGVSTVPAPANMSGTSAVMRRSASSARGVRKVISAHGKTAVEERARERNRVIRIVDRDHRNDAYGAQSCQSVVRTKGSALVMSDGR